MAKAPRRDLIVIHDPYAPISRAELDALGFGGTANFIAETIVSRPSGSSWVLGIDGAWGSGKSSLINLVLEILLANDRTWRAPIVVRFEPWMSGNTEALIANFFQRLARAFDDVNEAQFSIWSPRRWYLIWLKLRLSGNLSTLATSVSGAGLLATLSGLNIFLAIAVSVGRVLSGRPTLEEQKQDARKLVTKLLGANKQLSLLIIVDDLDRLEPDEALEVIRLVKAIANFPSVTYALAYDGTILCKAIETASKVDDGAAYLEKIIQFGFKVPTPSAFAIRKLLQQKLKTQFPNATDWESNRAHIVLDVWAGRLLQTPRDAIKIYEAVCIMWPKLASHNADLVDLIWLEVLKERASGHGRDLYSWVLSYARSLEAIAIGGSVSHRLELQRDLIEILKNLGWKKPENREHGELDFHHLDEILVGCTKSYVPAADEHVDSELWIFSPREEEIAKAVDDKRFSSPWHWSLYSGFRLSDHALSDDVWDRLKQLANELDNDLIQSIESIMNVEQLAASNNTLGDQFIDRVENELGKCEAQVALFWFNAIIDTADLLYWRSASTGFSQRRNAGGRLPALANKVFSRLVEPMRSFALQDVFRNGRSIWALAEIYRDQSYHFAPGHAERNSPYLSAPEFEAIQTIMQSRLEDINSDQLISMPAPWAILRSARIALGETHVQNWFARLIADDRALLGILESLKIISSSEQDMPGVVSSWLKNYTDIPKTKQRVELLSFGDDEAAIRARALVKTWWDED